MRALPDSPSLDHLRRQAKDVLPHLRALREGATLSDAQAHVAHQYGFRTWTDLKAEVDRRSATATPADEVITASIVSTFDLGPPCGPMSPVAEQWAGHAWALTTERGRWLARRLFGWFEEGALEHELLLSESAAAAGIVTLRPVRSTSGRIVEEIAGSSWRVYATPAVGPEPTTPADPRHAAAAGRIVGKVHALRLPAPAPVTPWLTCLRSEHLWRSLHAAAADAAKPWADRLEAVIPTLLEANTVVEPAPPSEDLVLSGCHYAPGAFAVAGADDLAVMTWEHAGAIPPRWDFGSTLFFWSQGVLGKVHGPAAKALVAGYEAEHPLPEPLDLGIFSAALCASTSWLTSRIRIALAEADPAGRDKADRTVAWLLEDPPAREKFEAVLDAL
jgi:hypothetical protein